MEIFAVNTTFDRPHDYEFLGARIDSGAQSTVIEKQQSLAYSRMAGAKYQSLPKNDGVKYKFGDQSYDGLGKFEVRISITETYFVDVEAQVVYVWVPFLLDLDVLSRIKVVLNLGEFTMTSSTGCWTIPLVNKLGHSYV